MGIGAAATAVSSLTLSLDSMATPISLDRAQEALANEALETEASPAVASSMS